MTKVQLLDALHDILEESVEWADDKDRDNMRAAVKSIRLELETSFFNDLKDAA